MRKERKTQRRKYLIYPLIALIIISIFLAWFYFNAYSERDLTPRQDFVVEELLGEWNEIARLPNRFQKGCVQTTATYTLKNDGNIEVLNKCLLITGEERTAVGVARTTETNGVLKVSFNIFLRSDYIILHMDDNYNHIMVSGAKQTDTLWILSRGESMTEEELDEFLGVANARGFDTTKILLRGGTNA